MTVRDDFDRLLAAWLDESAGAATPDYLDETLAGIDRIRQRPAWLSPGRWLPMDLTLRRVAVPRVVPALSLIALLVIALIVAAVLVGSQRRLPPPFGLAATGQFVYDNAGDLFVANADGTAARLLVGGPEPEFGATWSRDGGQVAYWSGPERAATLWVVDRDGSKARIVSGDLRLSAGTGDPAASWSPDGRHLAFATTAGALYVTDADGLSAPRRLGDEMLLHFDPAWSPDGALIAFRGEGGGQTGGVYVVRVDGTGETRVSETPGSSCCPERRPAWSPDGTRIAYHISVGAENDIFIAERTGSGWTETRLEPGPADSGVRLDSWPAWSNDGTRISFVRSRTDNHGDLFVMSADGTGARMIDAGGIVGFAPHCWTPDDRSIVVVNAELNVPIDSEARPGFRIVSVDGSSPPREISTPDRLGFTACSWQRLASDS
jgi:Tol biopolymer transport system component